jgi:hypothetical protein
MRRSAILIALLAAVPAEAQVIREMTPDLVKRAAAEKKGEWCYRLSNKRMLAGDTLASDFTVGCFTTPYSRVALAANMAREKLETFDAEHLPAEMLAPELHVHAFPRTEAGVISVQKVLVMPRKSKDPAQAVQPTRTEDAVAMYRNLMGAQFEGKGLTAVFPLEVLSDANDVRIVYEAPACSQGFGGSTSTCAADFKIKGVR